MGREEGEILASSTVELSETSFAQKIKSASGGPLGLLAARQAAGGESIPSHQPLAYSIRVRSRVRFARASVRRGDETLPRRAGGAALDLENYSQP
ncbi:hypothetical protein D3C76_665680 [compost metagenome]